MGINFTFTFFPLKWLQAQLLKLVVSLKKKISATRTLDKLVMNQSLGQFVSSESKTNATRETNIGETSHKCNKCDFDSSWRSRLMTHMQIHNGEKSHKCNQCDFASIKAGNLRRHLKTHRGEKLSKCNQCDNAFSWADQLREHLKTHSQEK